MILLSNNIRGMESDLKQKNIKEICIANKVSVLGLQETMVPLMSELQIRLFWGNNSFDFLSQSSRGKSGGLITIWDPVLFCKHSSFEGNGYLVVIGSWLPNAMQIGLINVYAPQQPAQKTNCGYLFEILCRKIVIWRGLFLGTLTKFGKKLIEEDLVSIPQMQRCLIILLLVRGYLK